MKLKPKTPRKIIIAFTIAAIFSIFAANIGFGSPLFEPESPTAPTKLYLPLVIRPSSGGTTPPANRAPNIFGVETTYIDNNLVNKASGINATWWRYFAFSWKGIEPTDVSPSQYSWSNVNEQALINASANGFTVVATVKYVPYWAQAYNDPQSVQCSPIKNNSATIADFQEFVTALVNRYKQPPYNIKYWEFWNEPDVDPAQLLASGGLYSSNYGCWGVPNDPYFGGEEFGKFQAIFNQTIKAADPQAKTISGGLLMDCNPYDGQVCPQGTFFEGMVRGLLTNNGMNSLDYVGFHVYGLWISSLKTDEAYKPFQTYGGVMMGKIRMLREVMTNYGINPTKQLFMDEVGLACRRGDTAAPLPSGIKCSDPVAPPEFEEDQAEYVIWVYVRSIAENLAGVTWYTLNYQNWRHVGLLNSDGTPKPAYYVYQNLENTLSDAQYTSTLSQYWPNLRAYEFTKNSQRIWILWSPDTITYTINLPQGFQAAYDKFGNQINLSPGATTIGIESPVFLFLN